MLVRRLTDGELTLLIQVYCGICPEQLAYITATEILVDDGIDAHKSDYRARVMLLMQGANYGPQPH
jgi:hypothetical protein